MFEKLQEIFSRQKNKITFKDSKNNHVIRNVNISLIIELLKNKTQESDLILTRILGKEYVACLKSNSFIPDNFINNEYGSLCKNRTDVYGILLEIALLYQNNVFIDTLLKKHDIKIHSDFYYNIFSNEMANHEFIISFMEKNNVHITEENLFDISVSGNLDTFLYFYKKISKNINYKKTPHFYNSLYMLSLTNKEKKQIDISQFLDMLNFSTNTTNDLKEFFRSAKNIYNLYFINFNKSRLKYKRTISVEHFLNKKTSVRKMIKLGFNDTYIYSHPNENKVLLPYKIIIKNIRKIIKPYMDYNNIKNTTSISLNKSKKKIKL